MTQNNNFTVLPFYTDIELQNHRRSYAFGAIYPLYTPANMLLPFQVMRKHRLLTEVGDALTAANTYNNYYIDATGLLVESESGYDVATYNVAGKGAVYLQGLNNPNRRFPGALLAVAKDNDNNVVASLSVNDSSYTGVWELPTTATYISVQIKAMGTLGEVLDVTVNKFPIKNVSLFDKNGIFVADLTEQMNNAGLQIVPQEFKDLDIIIFPGTQRMDTAMKDGQYYLTMTDNVQTWYSEIITIVQDMRPYLKIEWYDEQDLVCDSGIIIYSNPLFRNRLYLCTELGKPEYGFEEEAQTRDGYLFPLKQLSEKTYRFTALAPEYLCDAMRLIRMADYIKITDKYGREYKADSFLITPQWQTQGDLASIEVEFETNTVVKKIGRGVVRVIGDYNNDFNNDFNK